MPEFPKSISVEGFFSEFNPFPVIVIFSLDSLISTPINLNALIVLFTSSDLSMFFTSVIPLEIEGIIIDL